MRKHKLTSKVQTCGAYEAVLHPKGGYTVYGPSLRKEGFYVPSDSYLKQQFHAFRGDKTLPHDMNKLTAYSLQTMLSWRGVLASGKRSVSEGCAALGLAHKIPAESEVIKAVRSFWSSPVEQYYKGECNELPTIAKFIKEYPKEYQVTRRRPQGLQKMIEKVFPHTHYPDVYIEISQRTNAQSISIEELSKRIFASYCEGRPISRTEALHSPIKRERKMACEIIALAKLVGHLEGERKVNDVHTHVLSSNPKIVQAVKDMEKQTKAWEAWEHMKFSSEQERMDARPTKISYYTGVAHALTQIPSKDVGFHPSARHEYFSITEELTSFLFLWSFITDLTLPYFSPGKIYQERKFREFTGSHQGIADLRVNDTAVEVKTGLHIKTKQLHDSIFKKYKLGNISWKSGHPIDNALVVIHQNPQHCRDLVSKLSRKDIPVLEYPQFRKYLKEVVPRMQELYPTQIAELSPRIHDLSYLVRLHEEVSLHPSILMRTSNSFTRNYSREVLKSLLRLGNQIYHGS